MLRLLFTGGLDCQLQAVRVLQPKCSLYSALSSHLQVSQFGLLSSLPVKSAIENRQLHRRKMSSNISNHLFGSDAEKEQELIRVLKCGWIKTEAREAIQRSFQFKDFNEAFSFMTAIAMQAEKLDHHPEWSNVYNKVDITLASHFCNGISKLDIRCADYIDKLYISRYSN